MFTSISSSATAIRTARASQLFIRRSLATATASPSSSSLSSASSSSSSTSGSSSASSSTRDELAWSVPRTPSGELPVYSKVRNGGGWRTIIRKVDGDVRVLQSELNTYLRNATIDPLRAPPAAVLRTTNRHLEIRGRWVGEVKEWLEARGF